MEGRVLRDYTDTVTYLSGEGEYCMTVPTVTNLADGGMGGMY